jgi:hypothetical protein
VFSGWLHGPGGELACLVAARVPALVIFIALFDRWTAMPERHRCMVTPEVRSDQPDAGACEIVECYLTACPEVRWNLTDALFHAKMAEPTHRHRDSRRIFANR